MPASKVWYAGSYARQVSAEWGWPWRGSLTCRSNHVFPVKSTRIQTVRVVKVFPFRHGIWDIHLEFQTCLSDVRTQFSRKSTEQNQIRASAPTKTQLHNNSGNLHPATVVHQKSRICFTQCLMWRLVWSATHGPPENWMFNTHSMKYWIIVNEILLKELWLCRPWDSNHH